MLLIYHTKNPKKHSISRRIRELKYNIHAIYYLISGMSASEILNHLKKVVGIKNIKY